VLLLQLKRELFLTYRDISEIRNSVTR